MKNVTVQGLNCMTERFKRLTYACPACSEKTSGGGFTQKCSSCAEKAGYGFFVENYLESDGDYKYACGDCKNRTAAWKALKNLASAIGCEIPANWTWGRCNEISPNGPPQFEKYCSDLSPSSYSFKILKDAFLQATSSMFQNNACKTRRTAEICSVCGTKCCKSGTYDTVSDECSDCVLKAYGTGDPTNYYSLFSGKTTCPFSSCPGSFRLFPYACKLCPEAETAYEDLVKHSLKYNCKLGSPGSPSAEHWCIDISVSEAAG